MTYVIDTNSFRVLANYYPKRLPTLWDHIDELVATGRWTFVREVRKELELRNVSPHIDAWVKSNKAIFVVPSTEELEKVAEIPSVRHFQQLIGAKQRLKGMPVADPFIVACAIVTEGCVVTEEVRRENAAKIPNACDHFGVDCINLEALMAREWWQF